MKNKEMLITKGTRKDRRNNLLILQSVEAHKCTMSQIYYRCLGDNRDIGQLNYIS